MNTRTLRIISGIILTIALAIIGFCIYIIPYAFFGLSYQIPDFLLNFVSYLERMHDIKGYQAYLIILFGLILIVVILFKIIALLEVLIEKTIIKDAEHPVIPAVAAMADEEARELRVWPQLSKLHPMLKYLAAILLLLLLLEAVEFLITRVRFEGIF